MEVVWLECEWRALLLNFSLKFPSLSLSLVKASRIKIICYSCMYLLSFLIMQLFREPLIPSLLGLCWISHDNWVILLEDLNELEMDGLVMKMDYLQAWKCEF